MKQNTSVSIDAELIKQVRDMGMSVSGFTEKALETLVSDGFDDFTTSLKIKLYGDALSDIQEEISACNNRITELESQLSNIHGLLDDAREHHELALSVGKIAKLTQQLNRVIIMNNYNVDVIADKAHSIIVELFKLNEDFNLDQHVTSLRRILND